jgi:release factor glutamine methyltransferase
VTCLGSWLNQHQDLERLDRELLICEAMRMTRAQVLARPETPLPATARRDLNEWARRLRDGEPLAYLLGRREFWGLSLNVCDAVLIPRPETELLVELALAQIRPGDRVLDLGTGSGAIAIAVASTAGAAVQVTGSDNSTAALAVASENGRALGTQVSWVCSNWFDSLPGPYEIILSNPPYIAENDPHLAALGHEPRAALTAGPDGLDAIRHIVPDALQRLSSGGWLMLEHGYQQGNQVRGLMQQAGLIAIETLTDLAGLDRVTRGRRA